MTLNSDKLLEAAKATRSRINKAAYEAKKNFDESAIGKTQRHYAGLAKFWGQFVLACKWIYVTILRPVGRWVVFKPAVWLLHKYIAIWNRLTYATNQYGTCEFSPTRGGIMIACTAFFLWYMALPIVGFFKDAVMYATTGHRNELVYLFDSQEIYPDDDIHSIKGCKTNPCSSDDTIYYRVQPRLFNLVWSLVVKQEWFLPDQVAVVPPGVNKCYVNTYGFRITFLTRTAKWYQELIELKCEKAQDSK